MSSKGAIAVSQERRDLDRSGQSHGDQKRIDEAHRVCSTKPRSNWVIASSCGSSAQALGAQGGPQVAKT